VDVLTSQPPAERVPLEVLLEHREWVRALARSLMNDSNAADDVEQETWRLALERPPRHAGSLRAWFGTVVRNAARVAERSERSRARRESAVAWRPEPRWPDDLVAEAEIQHRLVEAVLELDEPYRATVLARYFQGMETSAIAARSGVPVETVRTRLKRAIERLRERMDVELGDDRDAWCLLVFGHRPIRTTGPTGTGVAIGAAGGVVMGATTKWAFGAAAALIAAGFFWHLESGRNADVAATHAPRLATESAAARSESVGPLRHPAQFDAATESRPSSLPPPVDLSSVDRDGNLRGVVVRRDGTPVAGASVVALADPWRKSSLLHWDSARTTLEVGRTCSAADGTFGLSLRRGTSVVLKVSATGFPDLTLSDRQPGERVRAVLDRGANLVLTVLDDANHLLPAVKLRVSAYSSRDDTSDAAARDVVTGPDGVGRAEGLPGGSLARVEVVSNGYADPEDRSVQLPDTGETTFRVVLPTGRTLRGRVVDDATGEGIARAHVGLSWGLDHAVEADAGGYFRLPGPPSRPQVVEQISAAADGYARAAAVLGAGSDYDFRLRRGFEASGRAVDGAGRPVRGALVELVASVRLGEVQHTSSGDAVTDAEGRFRVTGLDPTMPHVLVVVADGFGTLRRLAHLEPGNLSLDLGDVALPAAHLIAGQVLDAKGKRMPRVSVEIYGPAAPEDPTLDKNPYGNNASRLADDQGRFAFGDLAAGEYSIFVVVKDAPYIRQQVVVPAEGDVDGVVVHEPSSAGVEVHVVDEHGTPLALQTVLAFAEDGMFVHATTDAQGVARLNVTCDLATIAAELNDVDRHFLACREQRWKRGFAALTFVAREGSPISGVVLDPSGAAVAGAFLRLESTDGGVFTVATDPAGRFREIVPLGAKVQIVFDSVQSSALSGFAGTLACTAPAADLVVRCQRVATDRMLTVKVTTLGADAPAGVEILVTSPLGGERRTATTDAQGVARFEGLPARPRSVVAMESGPWARSVNTTITPDGQQIALALRAAVEIRGTVVGADGKLVAATVIAVLNEDDVATSTTTQSDGRFVLHVPAEVVGPFRVEARKSTDLRISGVAEGVVPGAADVRIVLPK
jgi:RNA polymerase sigma factor (sigma-70 family)